MLDPNRLFYFELLLVQYKPFDFLRLELFLLQEIELLLALAGVEDGVGVVAERV